MTGVPSPDVHWHLVVPVKVAAAAKSRLVASHPRGAELAGAIVRDTLGTVARALPPERVTVVTSDPGHADLARSLGARVVPDPGRGLDEAVLAGWRGSWPAPAPRTGWAVLLGDLPALRVEELRRALRCCAAHRAAVVPDAEGTGTVLLTGLDAPPVPRFGPGSAQRHATSSGAVVLDLDLPGLRRDVDTADDLADAAALGLGPATAGALGSAP